MKKSKLIKHKDQDLNEFPFSIKANPYVAGREKEKEILIKFIKNGDICFLTGLTGTGKTSLLLWLAKVLKSYNVFYIDAANIGNGFSIKDFLKSSRRGFDRFREYPTDCVILLDESQDCDYELQKALKLHWDHDHIKSIVVTQIEPRLENFSVSFRDRIGNRIVRLGRLNDSDAVRLIESRPGKSYFDSMVMKEIIKRADYIPRKILENCELISFASNGNKLKLSDVRKIIGKRQAKRKVLRGIKNKEIKTIEDKSLNDNPYESSDVSRKRLTLLQKKIILNLEKGFNTPEEIAENLKMPKGVIEEELRNLYENKLVVEI